MSKLKFTCSEEHFEKGYLFLRFFQNCFRTLSDNRPDFGRNFSTALPKLHSACPKNFSIFFAVVCHVLFNFGFERKNLSSEKKFRQFCQYCILNVGEFLRKFFSKTIFFSIQFGFWGKNVLSYQRKVSSRVVKSVFYVSSGPLWEWVSYFLKFSKVFELLAVNVWTSGWSFQQRFQTCILRVRRTFLVFFVNGSHVFVNFGLKRKK